jgi:hypothetical protein
MGLHGATQRTTLTPPVQQPSDVDIGSLVNSEVPVNSEVVVPLQVVGGVCGNGPAMSGLKPEPPASVVPSGTAPLAKSGGLTSPGVGGGEEVAPHIGEASDASNPEDADAVASVASTEKSAVVPPLFAVPLAVHWLMVPTPPFGTGLTTLG